MRTWLGRILLIFIALLVGCCVSQPKMNFNLPIQRPLLHKTVFVENNLEDWQKTAVIDALHAWECSTNNIVQFQIKFEADEETSMFRDPYYTLIITNTLSDNPKIVKSDHDRVVGTTTVGLYTRDTFGIPLILLVKDRLNESLYRAAVEHEVGHALGLVHESEQNSIMFSGVDNGAKHITKVDLKQFCNLYRCKADEFKSCDGG